MKHRLMKFAVMSLIIYVVYQNRHGIIRSMIGFLGLRHLLESGNIQKMLSNIFTASNGGHASEQHSSQQSEG
ncbi:hypothetical protein [Tuberibacillus sp. Marseille-P3662]|uniref:hypothetical protein n=1 Tax=Tuberibacillus sp. Marseille-P3662 TaxID=1965358 RepID=UPI000A1CF1F2|nr:hypothetical protein [Tuberibacillus sp. Marseille-P3662]